MLAGDDDPGLALAAGTQIFRDGLQIQQQLQIVAHILSHFVHHKDHMVVGPLGLDVVIDKLGEVFDGDGVIHVRGTLTPVSSSLLRHESHRIQHFHNIILHKHKVMPGFVPGLHGHILECALKRLQLALGIQVALQVSNVGILTAVAQFFIKDLQEHLDNCIPVVVAVHVTLGVDVEQNDVRRCIRCFAHICKDKVIVDLIVVHKILNGLLAVHHTIVKDIGQDFQEMRFTTAEEAGNPHAHGICGAIDAAAIGFKESSKVLLQLMGNNIFLQLLADVRIIILTDLDNASDITVDLFGKHITNIHAVLLL